MSANFAEGVEEAQAVVDAAEFRARLCGDLHRWSMGRTLTHQFSLAAKRKPKAAEAGHFPAPAPRAGERWQRYRVPPVTPPGLAAAKHAQQQNAAPAAPQERHSGPNSAGELYAYYKRCGMLEVYFSLFPGS